MSGVATYTARLCGLLKGTGIRLVDTRKTTPNMRVFEKYAVRVGGGGATAITFRTPFCSKIIISARRAA